jgi:hypothetical protein
MIRSESGSRRAVRAALAASLVGLASVASSAAFAAAADDEAVAQDAWRENIARTAVPYEGCFEATYPNLAWSRVACVEAPAKAYMPRTGTAHGETVGDGHDYAAGVTGGLMTSTVGSFPRVTGVTSERDGGSNIYSLQVNSNFMTTAACNGNPNCLSWEQFVYSSGERSAFMQYWLINYGQSCPAGWFTFSTDCYKNSAAVGVPQEAITKLSKLKLSGTAVANGVDTLVFTAGTKAYSTTGPDSVVFLATDWQQSEFNIIGDGGGSQAVFNTGSSITVRLAVTNGTQNVPTCVANAGTTGETNNLNLGACRAAGGAQPGIQFVESN